MNRLKRLSAGEYETPDGLKIRWCSDAGRRGRGAWILYDEDDRPCDAFDRLCDYRCMIAGDVQP